MVASTQSCRSCGTAFPLDTSFCPRCGTQAAASSSRVAPWLVAVGATFVVLLALGLVVWRGSALPRAAAGVGERARSTDVIPDISSMTPRERFDRLYTRVMQALRAGDAATVSRFAPMALAAYDMLDSADAAANRRRVTVLRLHLGDTTAAKELAKP